MNDTLTLTAANGIAFTAQILRAGDSYGRDNCLEVGAEKLNKYSGGHPALVEFYDTRYPFDKDKNNDLVLGQFIGRYYAATLLSNNEINTGLDLHGGVPDWGLDSKTLAKFLSWIKETVK
jgi:hypothetical protein